MKKILAICMAALLLLAALPVSFALADGEIGIVGTVDKDSVCAGDTVTLTLSIKNNPGLVAWRVFVAYDTAALTEVSREAGDIFPADSLTFNKKGKAPANAMFADTIADADYEGDGSIAIFTFQVNEGYTGAVDFDVYVKTAADFYDLAWGSFTVACEDVSITAGHAYDNACDASCNNCGAVREVEAHPYEGNVTKPEDCGNDGVKTYTCPICGDSYEEPITATGNHTYANACDADCDVCGAKREAAAHVYDNGCDVDCNVCGATREIQHVYDSTCDADCNECGATRVVEHTYTYACDKVCAVCGVETNPNASHTIKHVAPVAPTCYENGNVEYWYCEICGYAWLDAECTQVTNLKAVVLPMAHKEATHVEAKAATCYENGNIEYWYCEACGQAWLDAECTLNTNLLAVILPMAHTNVKHVEAKAPTCYENGNLEYWFCEDCGQAWLDAECILNTNLLAVVLPAGHDVKHVEAIEPACHYNGCIEYWVCYECETWWADEALTQITNSKNVILPAVGGEVIHVEAKAPTATENGNIEHWYCENCEQFWQDEALTQLTNSKNVILGALGEEPTKPEEPKDPTDPMGENTTLVVFAGIIALIAAAAVVVFSKKKA
ncbi:MAG: hypothetical protein IKU51_05635 [Clostridia bacterium]|nr:hypothetical protein [Clostridia bacterium]